MGVNNWEKKNRSLEEEVAALKADKEELQYILAAHRNTCSLQVKAEPVTEEESPVCVEGKPGLTPTNILSPTSLWGGVKVSSSLNTPTCGSQERRLIVTDLLSPSTQALLTSL